MKLMKKHNSKPRVINVILFMFFIVPLLLSCNDDDEASITVCNLDNHEYDVELRRESDDSVVGVKHLEEWYDPLDHCDTFNNVNEGRYYIAILDGDATIVDQSNAFNLDGGEHRTFNIDSDGDINNHLLSLNETTVSVCNLDDDSHRVALKRSSDDHLVADVDLEHQQDVLDHCIDFDGLDEGRYYIEIDQDDNDKRADRSDDFYLAPYESESFTINQEGKLVVEVLGTP